MANPKHPGESGELSLIKFVVEQISAAQKPVLDKLEIVQKDISEINGHLAVGTRRMDEHSDFIEDAREKIEEANRCREKCKAEEKKKEKPHWALVLLVGGALTLTGERLGSAVIRALQDPQTISRGAPP